LRRTIAERRRLSNLRNLPRRFAGQELTRAFVRAFQLSPVARALAITLAARANAQGEAWPQTRRLAEDAGCSATSARRGMRELIAAGILVEHELRAGELFPSGRAASASARITRFQVFNDTEVAAALKARLTGAQAQQTATEKNAAQLRVAHVRTDSARTAANAETDRDVSGVSDRRHLIGRSRSERDLNLKKTSNLTGDRARSEDRRAAEAAPSAYGAHRAALERAESRQADGRKRPSASGAHRAAPERAESRQEDGPKRPSASGASRAALERAESRQADGRKRPSAYGAHHAAPERAENPAELKISVPTSCNDATHAACSALAAYQGERESYPAAWVNLAILRFADGFSAAELASALQQSKKAPWFRDQPGRQSPGFVFASPDRVAALAELARRATPAPRIVARVHAAENSAEKLAQMTQHETLTKVANLLAGLDSTTTTRRIYR